MGGSVGAEGKGAAAAGRRGAGAMEYFFLDHTDYRNATGLVFLCFGGDPVTGK